MSTIKRFEDLEIWKMAREICKERHNLMKNYPFRNDYALVDQMNRAVRDTFGSQESRSSIAARDTFGSRWGGSSPFRGARGSGRRRKVFGNPVQLPAELDCRLPITDRAP